MLFGLWFPRFSSSYLVLALLAPQNFSLTSFKQYFENYFAYFLIASIMPSYSIMPPFSYTESLLHITSSKRSVLLLIQKSLKVDLSSYKLSPIFKETQLVL